MLVPYAAVASPSGEVLVEHRARSGNADEIAARILRRLTREGTAAGRRSFSMPEQGFTFRIAWGAGGGQAFVCMERGVGEPGAWRLLGRMRQRWEQRFGPGATAVSAHAAAPFASVLAEVCARPEAAADGGGAEDELSVVNQQLEQVRTVMADSIEKVLERGERIELLVERADRLEANAVQFSKGSTHLRRNMQWQARKFYAYVGGAIAVAFILLACTYCDGPTLSGCRRGAAGPLGFVPV